MFISSNKLQPIFVGLQGKAQDSNLEAGAEAEISKDP